MTALIAGNWKMNSLSGSARTLVDTLAGKIAVAAKKLPEVAVCPPAALIPIVRDAIGKRAIVFGGQDCHPKEKGAHTGDISAWLLKDLGCKYVIVGHSERRTDHGETDALVQAKATAAHAAGLIPIVCVGETEAERDRGETQSVIARQVGGSLPSATSSANTVIAYEPVWAIGTGRTPTVPEIAEVHRQIRQLFAKAYGGEGALRILYGGSVKGSNAAQVLAAEGVNGALVGGASLDADDFWRIIEACPVG
jgi:triosephosphate isomerase